LNPGKFGSLANHRQETWKVPLPQFIEEIYLKRYGKTQPESVRSIETVMKDREQKKLLRREAKKTTLQATLEPLAG
jgi:hypothetical protein